MLLDPDASHLAGTVVLLMQLRNAPFRTIVEVRAAVEPVVAGLAAERMPAGSLAELAGTVEQLRAGHTDPHSVLAADRRFHDLLARACGNPLFGYLLDALLAITAGIESPGPGPAAVLTAHEAIHAAVAAGDRAAATDRMRAHLEECRRHLSPEVLDQVVQWDRMVP